MQLIKQFKRLSKVTDGGNVPKKVLESFVLRVQSTDKVSSKDMVQRKWC